MESGEENKGVGDGAVKMRRGEGFRLARCLQLASRSAGNESRGAPLAMTNPSIGFLGIVASWI